MAQYSRKNSLSQALDIAGSKTQLGTKTLTDETSGFGQSLAGQTGSGASLSAKVAGVITVTGLTGMTANSVGNFLTVSGADTSGNNGTFLIIQYVSATEVKISNSGGGTAPDDHNGSIGWIERGAYTLEDDLNFERTDRAAIKGVAYDQPIPVYQRPTAIGTDVPTNLSNIASKTTDARGFIIPRKFGSATVAATNTKITLSSTGNLEHSDSTDKTGIPCFDAAPYASNYIACYVDIKDPATGDNLIVKSGAHTGEAIFGVSNGGASTSPDGVEIIFYSCPVGGDIGTNSTAYTWESGQPTSINVYYGYFQRLDQIPETAFRLMETLGLEESGEIRQDITDIQTVIGMTDGDTYLVNLTNLTDYYVFSDLGTATPSITNALNTINEQIGDRTYLGAPYIADGETVSASLMALANAISASSIVRYIERLASDANANTSHATPAAYTLGSGANLWVYWRGVLRDPGTVANGDDYEETDTTHITPYSKISAGEHINYFIMT